MVFGLFKKKRNIGYYQYNVHLTDGNVVPVVYQDDKALFNASFFGELKITGKPFTDYNTHQVYGAEQIMRVDYEGEISEEAYNNNENQYTSPILYP